MVDTLKEITDLIKDLPELAVWILVGLLFYKVVIIGSYFGIIRLAILKLHDYLKSEKKQVYKTVLDKHFITHDQTPDLFMDLIRLLKKRHNRGMGVRAGLSDYVHSRDVEWAIRILEKEIDN